jgi:hypothetical protein
VTTAPQAASTQVPDPGDKRRQRLLSYSTKNMVYSLLAVFALSFGIWAMMPPEDAIQRREVEVDSVAAYAAAQVGHPVWVPEGLPEGWTVTHVRLITVAGEQTWRWGGVAPSGEFVALSQAVEPGPAWEQALLRELEESDPVSLDGPAGSQQWQRWTGEGETALLLEPAAEQSATTVVHGSAAEDELAELIEHLEPAS